MRCLWASTVAKVLGSPMQFSGDGDLPDQVPGDPTEDQLQLGHHRIPLPVIMQNQYITNHDHMLMLME